MGGKGGEVCLKEKDMVKKMRKRSRVIKEKRKIR
jgi:hypothetical protein